MQMSQSKTFSVGDEVVFLKDSLSDPILSEMLSALRRPIWVVMTGQVFTKNSTDNYEQWIVIRGNSGREFYSNSKFFRKVHALPDVVVIKDPKDFVIDTNSIKAKYVWPTLKDSPKLLLSIADDCTTYLTYVTKDDHSIAIMQLIPEQDYDITTNYAEYVDRCVVKLISVGNLIVNDARPEFDTAIIKLKSTVDFDLEQCKKDMLATRNNLLKSNRNNCSISCTTTVNNNRFYINCSHDFKFTINGVAVTEDAFIAQINQDLNDF